MILLLTAMMVVVSCQGNPDEPFIDLSERPPINDVYPTQLHTGEDLVFAVAAVNSPLSTFPLYEEMAGYLAEKLGRSGRLVGSRTYAEINSLIRSGDATVAMVCSAAYVYGREQFGMQALVVPVVDGQTTYYSYLIASTRSRISGWGGLKGLTFAFTDPMSNSGRLVPIHKLWEMGETPDSFFQRYIFTYSHDNSIKAVARGLVDAAAVDSLVYDYVVSQDEEVRDNTKIVWRSRAFGINPIVVNPNLNSDTKEALRREMLRMRDSPEGADILDRLGFQRLVPADDSSYDSIRQIMERVGFTGEP